jgi:type IV pilus assembly protein PilM
MADNSFAVFNLGSQRVSGAVFTKARNGDLVLKAAAFAEMHGDPGVEATRLPQLRVAVLELADKLRLKGKDVWYAIAGHVVFTRFVKLPPFDEEKADQIVEFEARQNVPFPINEVIWDYEFIGPRSGAEREVALVAIKADALNDVNDQVEAGGVKSVGVDLAPLAVYNAFRYGYPDVDGSALIVDLGAKSTNLIFVENERVFTRNILVGGSTVTGAIAKELGMAFGDAEHAKRTQGYVAPGGAYEPNPDEMVDAMAKIMRNTMTRLHGEIVRTMNYYRAQQGGTPPQRIFLCGGGAQTSMVAEFFQEKFNLPVEVLNPLRGVQMDRGANQAEATANAPSMGELVGLALRHTGATPVQVELVPDVVTTRRDSAKRAPYLMLATLCSLLALLVGVFYFKRANTVVQEKITAQSRELSELRSHDQTITEQDKQLKLLTQQSHQLEQAVNDRSYWVKVLGELNNRFETDLIWLTLIEVLRGESSITPPLWSGSTTPGAPVSAPAPVAAQPANAKDAAAPAAPQFQLRIQGLYRKNEEKGPAVVYDYFNKLKEANTIFVAPPPDVKPEVNSGLEDDRFAYDFRFRMPLVQGMKFEK